MRAVAVPPTVVQSIAIVTFIGLDLAWTARKETGICWFEGETVY